MTGILNFQNRTFLVKVMPCFIKLEKAEFASFSKIGKFSDVPELKHILTDPTLGFLSFAVLHQLQFNISLIVFC